MQLGYAIGIWCSIPLVFMETRVSFQYCWRGALAALVPSCRVIPSIEDSIERPALGIIYLVETALLELACLAIAVLVKDIGAVFGLLGGGSGTLLSFVLPALFYLRVVPSQQRSGVATLSAVALCLFGSACGTISIASTVAGLV